jgi:hypothetical protein
MYLFIIYFWWYWFELRITNLLGRYSLLSNAPNPYFYFVICLYAVVDIM